MVFSFKKVLTISLVIFMVLHLFSCNKAETTPDIPKPGIVLTFDDYSVNNWYKNIGLFDSLGVKATFYISNFNKLTAEQRVKLHDLQNHGHEIAYHSTNHVNFAKYLRENDSKKLIEEEITKGVQLMNNAGFFPTTFAYPYGAHTDALDKILLDKFQSVRALNGTKDLNNSLCTIGGNTMLHGLGIDESSKRSLESIEGLLVKAAQANKCAVLLVHNIQRTDINMQLPLWKLKRIIEKAKELDLKFYTVSEISK